MMRKSEVGELRPSQVLTTFGIGSLVDLPNLSVMVMGLDDWPDRPLHGDRRGAAAAVGAERPRPAGDATPDATERAGNGQGANQLVR